MAQSVNPRRDAARRFFENLETALLEHDTLSDKDTLRRWIAKAEAEHRSASRKRFEAAETVRQGLVYPVVDEVIERFCRGRGIRTDPYACFRYRGPERGPTQHETAIGPSERSVRHFFERLADAAPVFAGDAAGVFKGATQVPAPDFRLQNPLPFAAAGDCVVGDQRADLGRALHRAAMYIAIGGDVARGWHYECSAVLFCAQKRPRHVLGDELWETWPEVRDAIWERARVFAVVF